MRTRDWILLGGAALVGYYAYTKYVKPTTEVKSAIDTTVTDSLNSLSNSIKQLLGGQAGSQLPASSLANIDLEKALMAAGLTYAQAVNIVEGSPIPAGQRHILDIPLASAAVASAPLQVSTPIVGSSGYDAASGNVLTNNLVYTPSGWRRTD